MDCPIKLGINNTKVNCFAFATNLASHNFAILKRHYHWPKETKIKK